MFINVRGYIFLLGVGILILSLSACEKFDRSKIAMPKMKFITGENLHSVACLDASHAWILGNHGTIYCSPDGGTTWNKQETGLDVLLEDAVFISKDEGWAVGVAGTIIHTPDGGKTWKQQKSPTGKDLLDVFFLDAQHGWAVGEYGTIINTADGGATWASQIEEKDTVYNCIFFADVNSGWVVGEFGTILHTEDGGKSWNPQECKDIIPAVSAKEWEKPLPALYGIFFLDRNQGWIVGMDGVIIKTEDSGKNWKRLQSGTDKPLYNLLIRGDKGWVVGNKGTYLMSGDGGNTWTAKPDAIKTKFWLRQVSFCDEKNGFIVGSTGTIATTGDGGVTWKIISGFSYEMEEFGLADF